MALAEELSGLSLHWPHRPPGPARQHPLAFLGTDTSFFGWRVGVRSQIPEVSSRAPAWRSGVLGLGLQCLPQVQLWAWGGTYGQRSWQGSIFWGGGDWE